MAYQARREKHFSEDFQLVDENGKTVRTIHVSLDADDMVIKLNRKYADLTKSLNDAEELKKLPQNNENMEQAFEKLGCAVRAMLESVFGPEDTKYIIEFYEGRYIEMTKEVMPFVTQVVIPQCVKIKNENRQAVLADYGRKKRISHLKKVR